MQINLIKTPYESITENKASNNAVTIVIGRTENNQEYYVRPFTFFISLFLSALHVLFALHNLNITMNIVYFMEISVFMLLKVPILKCEVFTSIESVTALLKTYDNVFNNLKHYIDEEEKRLEILKGYKEKYFQTCYLAHCLMHK